jgi:hypothetical protein
MITHDPKNPQKNVAQESVAREPVAEATPKAYEKPRLVTWSAEELDEAGATVSACVSYAF